ncbi:MAG TPA: TIM barrel protein [Fimbriimonadaceae bacterium]|nr:TIM barrel protein [Fimbriimonadaceae bacterium]
MSFRLHYAPHFGMFKHSAGDDPVDQLKFAAEEGFTAWEENGMKEYSIPDQERISRAMTQLGMRMGVFVPCFEIAWVPSLVTGKDEWTEKFLSDIERSVEVAKRMNATWMTVVPGQVAYDMPVGYQTANVTDVLKRASALLEPHGLVMVIEILNFRDHPCQFLTTVSQGHQICKAVGSPSCKLLNDLYHAQIQEGNLIPNIDAAWSQIGYFQLGDNPGRNEPGSGEINYRNVFRHICGKGYSGILGMEHGASKPGKEGERTLIESYREADSF